MAVHLGLGCVEIGPETRLLIMEHQGESYGFLVDAVTDAIALDAERIDTPPDEPGPCAAQPAARGLARRGPDHGDPRSAGPVPVGRNGTIRKMID